MSEVSRVVRWILTGDSAGAVKAFETTAVASEKAGAKVEASGKKAQLSLVGIEKGAKRTRGAVSTLAGTTGLLGLAFGIKDVVEAGVSWQAQQAQLKLALHGNAAAIAAVNKGMDESSTHGGFAVPIETQGVTQFIRVTHSATKALQLNQEAVDFARGANLDYASAVRLVQQAQTGNVGRLQRYLGIIIPAKASTQRLTAEYTAQVQAIRAATKGSKALGDSQIATVKQQLQHALIRAQEQNKTATAAAANAALVKKFGGAATRYSQTTAGAISNLNNQIHLLNVSLGRNLLGPLKDSANWLSQNSKLVLELGGGLLGTIAFIKAYELAVRGAAAAQGLWNLATKAFVRQAPAVEAAATTEAAVARGGAAASGAGALAAGEGGLALAGPIGLAIGGGAAAGYFGAKYHKQILHGLKSAGKGIGHFLGFASGGLVPGMATGAGDNRLIGARSGEFVLRAPVVQALGLQRLNAWNRGDGVQATTTPQALELHTHVRLNEREIAEAVTHYSLKRGAVK